MLRDDARRRGPPHRSPDADLGAHQVFAPARLIRSAVQQDVGALFFPGGFVPGGDLVKIGRSRRRVVYPLPQQIAAVDEVDGETRGFVLVREVAPQRIFAAQAANAFECASDQPPWTKFAVRVGPVFDVYLKAGAQLARMLLKCGFEPARPQAAATNPAGHDALHRREQRSWLETGRP